MSWLGSWRLRARPQTKKHAQEELGSEETVFNGLCRDDRPGAVRAARPEGRCAGGALSDACKQNTCNLSSGVKCRLENTKAGFSPTCQATIWAGSRARVFLAASWANCWH